MCMVQETAAAAQLFQPCADGHKPCAEQDLLTQLGAGQILPGAGQGSPLSGETTTSMNL